jgi:hypothetical protein
MLGAKKAAPLDSGNCKLQPRPEQVPQSLPPEDPRLIESKDWLPQFLSSCRPAASRDQAQARSILQSFDREGDGRIAQDELEHRNKVVLISPESRLIVNGQYSLSFLNGGDYGFIV